jgi:predicted transposase YdaD
MRRDTIFHKLFQQSPTLIFDFIRSPPENAARYKFSSIEVKETAYRFTALTRDEVMDMLGIESVTLQQTRFYQDVLEEGEKRGERSLLLKQLTRKLKQVPVKLQERVNSLEIDRLESLGEALLDFNSVADLEKFLDS